MPVSALHAEEKRAHASHVVLGSDLAAARLDLCRCGQPPLVFPLQVKHGTQHTLLFSARCSNTDKCCKRSLGHVNKKELSRKICSIHCLQLTSAPAASNHCVKTTPSAPTAAATFPVPSPAAATAAGIAATAAAASSRPSCRRSRRISAAMAAMRCCRHVSIMDRIWPCGSKVLSAAMAAAAVLPAWRRARRDSRRDSSARS